jgi:heme exporter protein D
MLTQLERNPIWWLALGFSLVIIGVILNAEFSVLSPTREDNKVRQRKAREKDLRVFIGYFLLD